MKSLNEPLLNGCELVYFGIVPFLSVRPYGHLNYSQTIYLR